MKDEKLFEAKDERRRTHFEDILFSEMTKYSLTNVLVLNLLLLLLDIFISLE